MNVKNTMAISLAVALCLQRLSMAIGSIFLGISIVCFLYLLKQSYNDRNLRERIEQYKAYYLIFAFTILSFLPSVIFSENMKDSLKLFCEMWFYRMMPFYIITLFIDSKKLLKLLFICLLCSISIDSLVALGQVLLGITYRGWGFGGNSLNLASILSIVIPIVLVVILDNTFLLNLKKKFSIAFFCMILGVLAGKSRGAWLTLSIVATIIILIYAMRNKRLLVYGILAFICLGGFFVTSNDYKNRFISIADTTINNSNLARISLWKSSWNMIKDHPIVGVGLGQFGNEYQTKYFLEKKFSHYNHCHNNILKIWTETGTIGLIGFLIMSLYILLSNFRIWFKDKNPYSLMIWSSWLSFMIFGMFDVIIDHAAITKIWWFLLGTLLVMLNKRLSL